MLHRLTSSDGASNTTSLTCPNAPTYILPTWHPIPEALGLIKVGGESTGDKTAPCLTPLLILKMCDHESPHRRST